MEQATEDFKNYTDTIVEFNRYLYDKTYNGDREKLGIPITELLSRLQQKWSSHNKTTLQWGIMDSEDLGNVILIDFRNNLTDTHLQKGMNREGIYLEMGIACQKNLPLMPDAFWKQWLDLGSLGNFELTENELFGEEVEKQYPFLFPKGESNIFRMMRNIIAFPIIHNTPIDLGGLAIMWPYEQYAITEVAEKGNLAFERMHHLNTLLIT